MFAILAPLTWTIWYYAGTTETLTVKVTNHHIKTIPTSDESIAPSQRYLIDVDILDEKGIKIGDETLENTDLYFGLKFNSSDYQRKMAIDSTRTVVVKGYRIPFFSMYRNIYNIKK